MNINRTLLNWLLFGILSIAGKNTAAQDWADTLEHDTLTAIEAPVVDYETETEVTIASESPVEFTALQDYDRRPVATRKVDTAKWSALLKEDAFWYVNTEPEKPKPARINKPDRSGNKTDFKWIGTAMWLLLIAAFLAIVIWFLVNSDIQFTRRRSQKIVQEADGDEEDIFEMNFEHGIHKAAQAANYRLAIRLQYLQLLRLLAEKEIIEYRPGRTNSAYVSQLYGTPYYADFFRATRNFEYAWYGQFPVSAGAYAKVRAEFDHLKKMAADA